MREYEWFANRTQPNGTEVGPLVKRSGLWWLDVEDGTRQVLVGLDHEPYWVAQGDPEPPGNVLALIETTPGPSGLCVLRRAGTQWTWELAMSWAPVTGCAYGWDKALAGANGTLRVLWARVGWDLRTYDAHGNSVVIPDPETTGSGATDEPPECAPRGTDRGGVLARATELVHGDRNAEYGPPVENFQRTADLWTAQLGHKLRDGVRFSAQDVALLMVQLKLARAVHSPSRDTFVDLAGYAAIGWEVRDSGVDDPGPSA